MITGAPYPRRDDVDGQGSQRYGTMQGDDGDVVVPRYTTVDRRTIRRHDPYGPPRADPIDLGQHGKKPDGIGWPGSSWRAVVTRLSRAVSSVDRPITKVPSGVWRTQSIGIVTLAEMPLAADLEQALLAKDGTLGAALSCALAFEEEDWSAVEFGGLSGPAIGALYAQSVAWANEAFSGL